MSSFVLSLHKQLLAVDIWEPRLQSHGRPPWLAFCGCCVWLFGAPKFQLYCFHLCKQHKQTQRRSYKYEYAALNKLGVLFLSRCLANGRGFVSVKWYFCIFENTFFFLPAPVKYFGDMLRVRLCQIEDQKIPSRRKIGISLCWCNGWPIFVPLPTKLQVDGIWHMDQLFLPKLAQAWPLLTSKTK